MPADRQPPPRLPADLAAVAALALASAGAVAVPVVRDSPLRVVLGLLLVVVLPGYAVVAALFPERGPARGGDTASGGDADDPTPPTPGRDRRLLRDDGVDGVERVALSVGVSVAVVPLVGLALAASPWGLRTGPVVAAVGGLTLVATAVAARRRRALPPADRFAVPYREWWAAMRSALLAPDSRADLALNVVLAASVLAAAASVGFAVAVPRSGQGFTELYLLAEDDSGALVADGYPTEFVRGEPRSLVVGVENHEGEPVSYTLVVLVQRVRVENGSATVVAEREVTSFSPRVAANGTWRRSHDVAPAMVGADLRLSYLLYEGTPPADPSVASAYREVHLWIDISWRGDDRSRRGR